MRIVAKFQFTTHCDGEDVVRRIEAVLDRWSDRKFDRTGNGGVIIRHSGANAAFDKSSETIEDRRRDTFTVLEPVDGGNLQTDVDIIAGAGRTAFRCVLSIGSDGGIAPADVSLRAPRFVREIVALGPPWTIGVSGERVFAHSFPIDADDVPELEALMVTLERRLPIIIVSELRGETLAGDLHERLSQDLCGLAHTVRLSQEASWELTRNRGKEWSCYNGAVRLLWPFRFNSSDFLAHPLWTSDQMLSRADSEVQARDRIRGVISRRIIEASTFVADDPVFRDFEVAKIRRLADQARALATDDGDMQALANAYAVENDALRARVDEQDNELEVLRENVETLNIALRSSQAITKKDVSEAPPQTVEEAVATARRKWGDKVVIGHETNVDIADINASAGPPDKILRYLQTLAELSDALAAGPLGHSVPIWLRERSVDCSVDSDTAKGSKEGKRFRTRMINGESVECEFHAKPSEGVSPDMCVRIYFATSAAAPFVRIGYIGRHFS